MRRFEQAVYEEEDFNSSRLNLHVNCADTTATVVLLVHGLNSSGYRAWGDFPKHLFELPVPESVDVALYDYRSGLRALLRRGQSFSAWSTGLRQSLEELAKRYERIYVVAHSMGGIIARDAARSYLEDNTAVDLQRKIAALVFVSTPFGGSALSAFLRLWLPVEWSVLRANSDVAARADDFFRSKVETVNAPTTSRPFLLPTFAIKGTRDRAVSLVSAGLGAPPEQTRQLDTGHIAAPKAREPDPELLNFIREIMEARGQYLDAERRLRLAKRTRAVRSNAVMEYVTEFASDLPDLYDWHQTYMDTLASLGDEGVSVRDANYATVVDTIDLSVFAAKNGVVLSGSMVQPSHPFAEVAKRVEDGRVIEAVLYTLVGNHGPHEGLTAPFQPPIYHRVVSDIEEFQQVLTRRIAAVLAQRRGPASAIEDVTLGDY